MRCSYIGALLLVALIVLTASQNNRGNRQRKALKRCYRKKCRENKGHCGCVCRKKPNSRNCRTSCPCEVTVTEAPPPPPPFPPPFPPPPPSTESPNPSPEPQIDGINDPRRAKEIRRLVNQIVKSNKKYSREDSKGNRFERIQRERDNFGNLQVRVQQQYRRIPVIGTYVVAQRLRARTVEIEDRDTGPTGESIRVGDRNYELGVFVDYLDLELGRVQARSVNPRQALEHFKTNNGHSSVSDEEAKAMIYKDDNGKARVVTYCTYFTDEDGTPTKPAAFIDENNEIIKEWEDLKLRSVPSGRGPGGNRKVNRHYYGSDQPNLQVTQNGKTCTLETADVRTIHLNWANSNEKTRAHSFRCFDNNDVEVNGAYSPLNDAHFFGQKIFDMYRYWYKKDPLNSKPLMLKVHYGRNYQNAYWDGRSMTFGDGGSSMYPLVSLDITAHEVAHGVTSQSSKLYYYGQSGGLNEAFSDMAGKAAEPYVRGKSGVNWAVGRDIMKGNTQLRCMNNPPCDGSSIGRVNGFYEGMDVHHSSGVFNKVFYLISQKLHYDVWDAFDIFYIANTKFWGQYTNFAKGAEGTLRAVDELKQGYHLPWGFHWVKVQDIVDAFRQVGIACYRNGQYWTCTS